MDSLVFWAVRLCSLAANQERPRFGKVFSVPEYPDGSHSRLVRASSPVSRPRSCKALSGDFNRRRDRISDDPCRLWRKDPHELRNRMLQSLLLGQLH